MAFLQVSPPPSPFLQVTTVTTPKVPGGPGEQSFCPSDQLGKETKATSAQSAGSGTGPGACSAGGVSYFLLQVPSDLPTPPPTASVCWLPGWRIYPEIPCLEEKTEGLSPCWPGQGQARQEGPGP